MEIKVVKTLDARVINGGMRITLSEVLLDDRQQAYFVGPLVPNRLSWRQGSFLMTKPLAEEYFELHVKYNDLTAPDLTPAEEDIYCGIHTRGFNVMRDYINR